MYSHWWPSCDFHPCWFFAALEWCFVLLLGWIMRVARYQHCAPRSCPLRMALHSKTLGANQAKAQDKTSCRHNGSCSWNKQDEKKMTRDLQTRLFFFVEWGVGLLCVNVGRFVLCIMRQRLLKSWIGWRQTRKRLDENVVTNSYVVDSSQSLPKNNYKN